MRRQGPGPLDGGKIPERDPLLELTRVVLSLDIMDISGEQQRDISHNVIKTRIDQSQNPVVDAEKTRGGVYRG